MNDAVRMGRLHPLGHFYHEDRRGAWVQWDCAGHPRGQGRPLDVGHRQIGDAVADVELIDGTEVGVPQRRR